MTFSAYAQHLREPEHPDLLMVFIRAIQIGKQVCTFQTVRLKAVWGSVIQVNEVIEEMSWQPKLKWAASHLHVPAAPQEIFLAAFYF